MYSFPKHMSCLFQSYGWFVGFSEVVHKQFGFFFTTNQIFRMILDFSLSRAIELNNGRTIKNNGKPIKISNLSLTCRT